MLDECFQKCPITGQEKNLNAISLIALSVANATTEPQVAQMEWAWGLERGGFLYYVDSPPNKICFRTDILKQYNAGDFVLLPTHKTFIDAMAFTQRAGGLYRDEKDGSPRRPLTALGKTFRYVFIPLKTSAENLIAGSLMQRQTDEDWNYGVHPITGEALDPWVKDYPVVEIHSHPVSVCAFAQEVLDYIPPVHLNLRPWTTCLSHFQREWGFCSLSTEPPQWFVDTDDRNDYYDESLNGSEASGYFPLPSDRDGPDHQVPRYASSAGTATSQASSRVMEWAKGLPRPRTVRSTSPNRSSRAAAKATIAGCFQSSPCRKVKPAKSSRSGGKVPSWTQQSGHFPTHAFTSNDWAMFCYGTRLSEDDAGYTD
ncbi:hypothetical protein EV122DRAFT_214903 [Schizophyllum commune]